MASNPPNTTTKRFRSATSLYFPIIAYVPSYSCSTISLALSRSFSGFAVICIPFDQITQPISHYTPRVKPPLVFPISHHLPKPARTSDLPLVSPLIRPVSLLWMRSHPPHQPTETSSNADCTTEAFLSGITPPECHHFEDYSGSSSNAKTKCLCEN